MLCNNWFKLLHRKELCKNTGHTGPSTAEHATPLVTMQRYSHKQVPQSDGHPIYSTQIILLSFLIDKNMHMFYISEVMPFKEKVHGAGGGGGGTVFHIQIITKTNVTEQNTQKIKIPFLRTVECFQTTFKKKKNQLFSTRTSLCTKGMKLCFKHQQNH